MAERQHSQKESAELNANDDEAIKTKAMELAETKKKLLQVRDTAMQSWLDSKPLIDELEKLQSTLTKSRNRVSLVTVAISTLESQLESTKTSIKTKVEEELKAKMVIDEINGVLDRTHTEMEKLKLQADEERRARAKLKQELRLRRQSLRSLRLMHRAIRMESEAFGASAAMALHHIKSSKKENAFIELSHEDYHALKIKADEETALADWRISVSMEQRHAANDSKEQALRRLAELYSENQSRKRHMQADEITEEQDVIKKGEKGVGSPGASEKAIIGRSQSLQHHQTGVNVNDESTMARSNTKQRMRRSKSNSYRKAVEKKPSFLHQIRSFFVRNIRRLFG